MLIVNQAGSPPARCSTRSSACGVTIVLRAADRLADADPGRPRGLARCRSRECVAAGEPLNPEVIERVRAAWGITVRDGYGQTETTAQIGNPPGQPVEARLHGPAAARATAIVLVDPVTERARRRGRDLHRPRPAADGADGRIPATRRSVRPRSCADGAYHTGDVATRDADGYITYVGRTDDVFKASDYRISPFELESVLLEHKAVAEAAVVPSPGPAAAGRAEGVRHP